jgi:thiamine biosynthesis lipoprotein
MTVRVWCLAVLACVAVPSARGESPALERYSYEEPHMGTRFGLLFYAPDEATANKASEAAFARVAELNRTMSDYLATSELMRLCAKAGGPAVKVSDDLFLVLKRARELSKQSDGAFDVTVGPVVRLWRLARKTRRLPDAEKLKAARALVGWKMVELDEKKQTVKLKKAEMQLDLGGIAKGYTADEVLKVLKKHGITRALVSAGGDLTAGDAPPGAKGWVVSIEAIDKDKEGPRHLTLANAAVSTSGDASQYANIDGVRYSHIVDPRTGLGLVGRMSATVVAKDGITADSLTKVVAILGPEKGFKIVEGVKGASARYVLKTDKATTVKTTKGFPKLSEGKKK